VSFILGYVLLGVLLISLIIPVVEGLTSLLLTIIEVIKGYFSVKITKYNLQLKEMSATEDTAKPVIGFGCYEEED
jgi:hypothetical protein